MPTIMIIVCSALLLLVVCVWLVALYKLIEQRRRLAKESEDPLEELLNKPKRTKCKVCGGYCGQCDGICK